MVAASPTQPIALDDELIFIDEPVELSPGDKPASVQGEDTVPPSPWKIMLVDDDVSIHQATKVALRFFSFERRGLEFISAYSVAEAEALIRANPDTVLVLLDVIMETSDAGLRVAQYIRETLHNKTVRIVLRTGQPGQVPEESVVLDYDINDYKTKLELTQKKLFTTLVSSLRAYRDLQALATSQATLKTLNHQLSTLNHSLEEKVSARTQSLKHEIQEKEKAEEALKLHIHALTHDLRNPVTGMNTVLQSLLEKEVKGTPPNIEIPLSVLTRMKTGCDRQLEMINTLLETHDIEIRGIQLQPQVFDFNAFIAEVLETWQPSFDKKRVNAIVNSLQKSPLVKGDRTQLWRVVENLLDNALKYNPPGITITLTISDYLAEAGVSFLRCSIADNGVGLRPERAHRIFQLYQRGSMSHRVTRGLGLGLYVCRRIIEAHGGQINVISEPKQGSEFWFTLPAFERWRCVCSNPVLSMLRVTQLCNNSGKKTLSHRCRTERTQTRLLSLINLCVLDCVSRSSQ